MSALRVFPLSCGNAVIARCQEALWRQDATKPVIPPPIRSFTRPRPSETPDAYFVRVRPHLRWIEAAPMFDRMQDAKLKIRR